MTTTPVRCIPRETQGIVEAMPVTPDNHRDVDTWVRSKGYGWHTHGKRWGNLGLGISPDGSGDRTTSVDHGQWLVWTGAYFFGCPSAALDERYVPASALLPDVGDDAQVRDWLLRLRTERPAVDDLAEITRQIEGLVQLRDLACWAALANREPGDQVRDAARTRDMVADPEDAAGDWRTRDRLARLGVDDANASADCRPRWNPDLG